MGKERSKSPKFAFGGVEYRPDDTARDCTPVARDCTLAKKWVSGGVRCLLGVSWAIVVVLAGIVYVATLLGITLTSAIAIIFAFLAGWAERAYNFSQAKLRQVFCDHSRWRHLLNLYGDHIHQAGGKRSVWECRDCQRVEYRKELHRGE